MSSEHTQPFKQNYTCGIGWRSQQNEFSFPLTIFESSERDCVSMWKFEQTISTIKTTSWFFGAMCVLCIIWMERRKTFMWIKQNVHSSFVSYHYRKPTWCIPREHDKLSSALLDFFNSVFFCSPNSTAIKLK